MPEPDGPTRDPFRLERRVVNGVDIRVFAGASDSLRDVLVASAAFGDRDFLVFEQERLTYRQHFDLVAGLAVRMRDVYGVGPGTRVAIAMRNYPEWIVAFWATQALGAVSVPLNAWWTAPELAYGLQDSGATVAFLDGERYERIAELLPNLQLRATVVTRYDGDLAPGVERWSSVRDALPLGVALPEAAIAPEDPATILYTSGTTGRPKGAVGSQRNHLTNWMVMAMFGSLGRVDGPAPSTLIVFPLFSISGLMLMYVYAGMGGKVVLQYRWDVDDALAILEREQVTAFSAVPTILRALLSSPKLAEHDLSSIVSMAAGAAPVPPELLARMGTLRKGIGVTHGYGITEATGGVAVNAGPGVVDHPTSVGRPLPMVDLRIVDPDTGADVPNGGVGEIVFKGPNVIAGYWNDPAATAAAFLDGWFRSGDIGYVDDDGMLFVVDRLKDVIIRGGQNIYCAEVEAAIQGHPGIAEVAVVGLAHPTLGEEVVAVVVVEQGTVSDEALRAYLSSRLATYKVPAVIVHRDDPLPRTATGKVLKRQLRDELQRSPLEQFSENGQRAFQDGIVNQAKPFDQA